MISSRPNRVKSGTRVGGQDQKMTYASYILLYVYYNQDKNLQIVGYKGTILPVE